MNRQYQPEVINYNQGPQNPRFAPNEPGFNQPIYNQTVTHHEQYGHGQEQFRGSWQAPNPYWKNEDLRGSQAERQKRFQEYRRKNKQYKYNFFSMIDEPWNRCCEVGKCGTCPGNECIAKKTPKRDWL